jgi:predicted RNA binding protein YcfA (HicA-like mRNA interferase family)
MKIVPNITGQQLESALGKIGFSVARVIGSHLWITHPDGRSTSMPIHEQETLQPGLVFKILRDIDLDSLDLYDLL